MKKYRLKITNSQNISIINTQHGLKINDDEIELIYLFEDLELQMYINAELVYSRKFQPGRIALNYNNVIEVASYLYSRYLKSKPQN